MHTYIYDIHVLCWPATSKTEENMERVATSVLTNRELSEDVDVSFRLIQSVLTDALGMERVSAKFVSVMLPADQKQAARHLLVCVEKGDN